MALIIMGTAANAQTIEKNLDKLAKDPKTAERAARADVYIVGKSISNDSAVQQKNEPAVKSKKQRKCKHKKINK